MFAKATFLSFTIAFSILFFLHFFSRIFCYGWFLKKRLFFRHSKVDHYFPSFLKFHCNKNILHDFNIKYDKTQHRSVLLAWHILYLTSYLHFLLSFTKKTGYLVIRGFTEKKTQEWITHVFVGLDKNRIRETKLFGHPHQKSPQK